MRGMRMGRRAWGRGIGVQAVKNRKCEKCGAPTAEGLPLCPACMEESGAAAEIVEAAEELRDIARVLSMCAWRLRAQAEGIFRRRLKPQRSGTRRTRNERGIIEQ